MNRAAERERVGRLKIEAKLRPKIEKKCSDTRKSDTNGRNAFEADEERDKCALSRTTEVKENAENCYSCAVKQLSHCLSNKAGQTSTDTLATV